jgi:hypothetical protein
MERCAHRQPAIVQRQCAAKTITGDGVGADQLLPLHPGDAIEGKYIHCTGVDAEGVVHRRSDKKGVVVDCKRIAKL